MAVPIQLRGGNLSLWTQYNPVIAEREMVLETDTNKFKIGNGVDNYLDLPYGGLVGPAGADSTVPGPQGAPGPAGVDGAPGKFITSATAPTEVTDGDGWFDTTTGRVFIRYDGFWVEPIPAPQAPIDSINPFLLGV